MNYRSADYAKAYRREHPLAIWFSIGIAFIGLVTILFPDSVEQSAVTLALPELVRKLFNVFYATGGLFATIGLLRIRHSLEAAGMALLASTLFVQWASIIYLRPTSIISAFFVLTLAIGCGRRAWILSFP